MPARPGDPCDIRSVNIPNPITSSTAADIIGCGESCVRYYVSTGRIRYHRLPSGINVLEREDREALARERQQRRSAVQNNAPGRARDVGILPRVEARDSMDSVASAETHREGVAHRRAAYPFPPSPDLRASSSWYSMAFPLRVSITFNVVRTMSFPSSKTAA